MSSFIYFQALYDFSGDRGAHQLSFAQGAILRVDVQNVASSQQDGWVWGTLVSASPTINDSIETNVSGWFPRGYVVLATAPMENRPPTLPWIQNRNRNVAESRDDNHQEGSFGGSLLGGHSPALDYFSTNKELHLDKSNSDNVNPFSQESTGPLPRLQNDDRITITATTTKPKTRRTLGQKLQKGLNKVGDASAKLLPRRRVATKDPYKPSISITSSSQQW